LREKQIDDLTSNKTPLREALPNQTNLTPARSILTPRRETRSAAGLEVFFEGKGGDGPKAGNRFAMEGGTKRKYL